MVGLDRILESVLNLECDDSYKIAPSVCALKREDLDQEIVLLLKLFHK